MKTTVIQPHKSSLGLDANIAVVIIYIAMAVVSWIGYLGWVTWVVPLIFFFLEKSSKFVKFQAAQALVLGIASAIFAIILRILVWISMPKTLVGAMNYAMGGGWGIWALFGTLATIIGVIFLVVEIYIIVTALAYKQVELPIIGPLALKASAKLESMNANKPDDSKKDDAGAQQ